MTVGLCNDENVSGVHELVVILELFHNLLSVPMIVLQTADRYQQRTDIVRYLVAFCKTN